MTAQLLTIIVKNERQDLEQSFLENSKEAYDAIKNLKGIERALLSQLEQSVTELLGGEELIKVLNESQQTTEYIA